MEVKWELQIVIGNRNRNNDAPIAGAVSSLSTHDKCALSLLLYCALVVILLAFMSHVLCLLYCALWLDIQCGWLVPMWRTILQSSLVYMWEGLGMRLVAIWPWEYFYLVLEWDQRSYSYSLITRPSLTSSFVICDANDGFIPVPYFSQVPGYAIPTPYCLQYLPDVC